MFKKLQFKVFILLLLTFSFINLALASDKQRGAMTVKNLNSHSKKGEPFYGFIPYVPQKREYGFELGAMWEQQNLYWIGAYAGFHLGTCMLSESQSCQQYFDVIGGAGGREGLTEGLVLGAIRWQFVSFPKFISPSARLFAGAMNIRGDGNDRNIPVFGVGYGLSAAVHEAIDLKLNFRVGGGEKTWSQTFFTVSVKFDTVINYFAARLTAFGDKAVNVTGKVIDGTGTVLKGTKNVIKKGVKATGGAIVTGAGALKKGAQATGGALMDGAEVIKKGVEKTGEVISAPLKPAKKSDK
ncbi:MAG: hypothetical protein HOO06_15250 [Bdellovibrionaceae bacterium]|jgi:hypothetical protein|nr:hypothetical protein [Pseudobdellovibrionaceae bacterium]